MGIGLEWGSPRSLPCCNSRIKKPASTLADFENGGLLISAFNKIRSLSFLLISSILYLNRHISNIHQGLPNFTLQVQSIH